MLYLDYAKPLADGKYILSFFADSVADLESISHGQKFVTKNGTDYGVPQAGSTVIVTSPNSGKTTYVMDAEGIWVVTEDISYSAVVANPSDAATAKLEKLKVNDTTYANWTQEEIKSIASESGGGKLYVHNIQFKRTSGDYGLPVFNCQVINSKAAKLQPIDFKGNVGCIVNTQLTGMNETSVPPAKYINCSIEPVETGSTLTAIEIRYNMSYPFSGASYENFQFDLTDGKTEYSDNPIEL